MHLDQLGVPRTGRLLRRDHDLDVLIDGGALQGLLQTGEDPSASDQQGHRGVLELLVEDAVLLCGVRVRGVEHLSAVSDVSIEFESDDVPFGDLVAS